MYLIGWRCYWQVVWGFVQAGHRVWLEILQIHGWAQEDVVAAKVGGFLL